MKSSSVSSKPVLVEDSLGPSDISPPNRRSKDEAEPPKAPNRGGNPGSGPASDGSALPSASIGWVLPLAQLVVFELSAPALTVDVKAFLLTALGCSGQGGGG